MITPSPELKVITRAEAKAAGLKRYFTGIACSNGHIAERFTSQPNCVECSREWRARNQEKAALAIAKWTAANKEKVAGYKKSYSCRNKEQERKKLSQYAAANKEAVRKARAKWRAKNPSYMTNYRNKNPEIVKSISQNRRAKIKSCRGSVTAKQISTLMKMQKYKCVICSKSLKACYHIDHVVPIKLGGEHLISNIQLLCPPCNLKKGSKDPIAFAQENWRLF